MKRIAILICSIIAVAAYGQKSTDNFQLEYEVGSYENVRIHNFEGDVKVTTKPGSKLELSVKRTLKAKTNSKLEQAKREVYLDTTVVDGEFIVFMVAPQKFFEIDEDGNSYYNGQNWNNWSKNDIKRYDVEYEFEIVATVPPGKNLYAATHHKNVEVDGIQGNTTVKSHHGSVAATTAGEYVVAKSHHGNVTVEHLSSNVTKGVYKTHHGDIRTSFPEVSAVASMDSHHGSFYVDFDYESVAQKVSRSRDGKKTKYKYKGGANVKIGGGKGKLTYKTHHGDTYITKI